MRDGDLDGYRPSSPGPTGLFLDTSGLFALFHPDAVEHDSVTAFFQAIRSDDLPYRPLVTNTHVVDELATLLVTTGGHEHARTALETLSESDAISISRETDRRFDRTRERFLRYDDREVSFTDHYCAVEMDEMAIDHVLAFDGDFALFGFTVLPRH